MRRRQAAKTGGTGAEARVKPLDLETTRLSAPLPQLPSRWWLVPRILLPVAVIAASIAGFKYFLATKPEVPKRPVQEQVYTVETAIAEHRDNRPAISVYGEIVAGRTVDLRTLVGGEIIAVNPALQAGAVVEAGAVLIEIDRFDYQGAVTEAAANLAEAKAKLTEAEAQVALEEAALGRSREQLAFAERDLERAVRLESRGTLAEKGLDDRRLIVSQRAQAIDQHENTLNVQRARIAQQKSAIDRLDWRLAQAERNLANTVLKAPFTAVVRSENAEAGRLVNVNDALVSLYDGDSLEARFTISDSQYGRLVAEAGSVVGRKAEVRWTAGDVTMTFPATIERVGAEIAAAKGGVDLYAAVDARDAVKALRPGAFISVSLSDRLYPDTVRLPEAALFGTDHVFAVEDDRLRRIDVAFAGTDGDHVLVSGDIPDGARILVTRIAEVGEGLKVHEVATDQPAAAGLEASAAMSGETRP